MKKRWSILLSAALLVVALGGCVKQNEGTASSAGSTAVSDTGSDTGSDTSEAISHVLPDSEVTNTTDESNNSMAASVPTVLESNTVQPSVIEFSLDHDRPYDTIEEYLQTEAAKEMIEKLKAAESSSSEVIRIAVFAEGGTKLVFERQFSTDFNLWLTDEFLENIKKNVEAQKDVYVGLVDSLESCINNKVLLVVVRYVDPEGNVLYEREFDNDRLDGHTAESRSAESQTSTTESSAAVSQTSKTESRTAVSRT